MHWAGGAHTTHKTQDTRHNGSSRASYRSCKLQGGGRLAEEQGDIGDAQGVVVLRCRRDKCSGRHAPKRVAP
eukprot:scaffold19059_cov114-Isochrysis_galbana.AAC.5